MFKKLLANLPFNPGLIDQVNFYAKRLRHEAVLRRFGFILMSLALSVQLLAALYPSQNSLAASPNDILNGITNKASILRAWDNNAGHIRAIYGKFGITRANIAAISGSQPNSTVVSTGRNYWSIGRLPLSDFGIDGNRWGERSVRTNGPTVYERPLRAWDTGGPSSYAAFHGRNQHGVDFWILQTCGNPTFEGPYLPSPPRPRLTVHKTRLTSATVHPGDTVRFRLEYQNHEPDSLATNFKLTDTINNKFEFVSLDDLSSRNGNELIIRRSGHLGYRPNPYVSTLVVKVKSNVANNTVICNRAHVSSDEDSATSPERPCVTVIVPNAPPAGGYCVASVLSVNNANRSFVIRTNVYVEGSTRITGYSYDVDSNGSIDYHDETSVTPYDRTISGLSPGTHTVSVFGHLINGTQRTQTPACDVEVTIAADARVNLSKGVRNLTRNVPNADGTEVQSGDTLEFKLTTQNVTDTDYLNFQGQDYFGSVLQYASLLDAAELTRQGITLGADNTLRWSIPNLQAGAIDIKIITVQVKPIVPATNSPSVVSPDYNCKITNDYGNEVTMSVSCPIVKSIAVEATNLPNTGPGTSIAIGGFVAVLAGYLFARSRLMSRELELVRSEYISGGL